MELNFVNLNILQKVFKVLVIDECAGHGSLLFVEPRNMFTL